MSEKTFKISLLLLLVIGAAVMYVTASPARGRGAMDQTQFDSLRLDGSMGTATPQLLVIPTAGNQGIEVRNTGGTPVFQINGSGTINGQVLTAPTPGQAILCGTTTVTGTSALTSSTHGMATPVAAQVSIAENITGDGARVSYLNSSGVITLSVWTSAATPVAASAGHVVSWCVRGTR